MLSKEADGVVTGVCKNRVETLDQSFAILNEVDFAGLGQC